MLNFLRNAFVISSIIGLAFFTSPIFAQTVSVVAGTGTAGYSGDGGPASAAHLNGINGVAVDDSGYVYISDSVNNVIRRVSPNGIIRTFAGNGSSGFSGDGGPATAATLSKPRGIAIKGAGLSATVYFVDGGNVRIRQISPDGHINTLLLNHGPSGSFGNYLGSYDSPGSGGGSVPGGLIYGDSVSNDIFDLYEPKSLYCDGSRLYFTDKATRIIGYEEGGYVHLIELPISDSTVFYGTTGEQQIAIAGRGGFISVAMAHLDGTEVVHTFYPSALSTLYDVNYVSLHIADLAIDQETKFYTAFRSGGNVWKLPNLADLSHTILTLNGTSLATDRNYRVYAGGNNKVMVLSPPTSVAPITGPGAICLGSTITLANADTGGTWHSLNGNASVSSSGIVTGLAVGVDTITYNVLTTLGPSTVRKAISINPSPSNGAITGPSLVCVGAPLPFADTATGGTWNMSSFHATINSSGVVTGISTGTATISYTTSLGICQNTVTKSVTIGSLPNVPMILGMVNVCVGSSSLTLSNAIDTGVWSSSSPALATVLNGVVTGVSAGTDTIHYSVTNMCGTTTVSKAVFVRPLPLSAAITAPSTNICVGQSINITPANAGGTWTRLGMGVYNTGGHITGQLVGSSVIKYTMPSGCGYNVDSVTIHVHQPSRPVVNGSNWLCAGNTATFTSPTSGGVWSVYNTHASIVSPGVISCNTPGADTILYSITDSFGCTAAQGKFFTVIPFALPVVDTITGSPFACLGTNTLLLHNTVIGGVWTTMHPAIATVNALNGFVSGAAIGLDTIVYTVTNHCGSTSVEKPIHVGTTLPATFTHDTTQICQGDHFNVTPLNPGGVWTTHGVPVDTSGGLIRCYAAGTTWLKYRTHNTCGFAYDSVFITVRAHPYVSFTPSTTNMCIGSHQTFVPNHTGGVWSAVGTHVSVSSTGVATANITGSGLIHYVYLDSLGCSDSASRTIFVDTFAGPFSVPAFVPIDSTVTLIEHTPGGNWYSSGYCSFLPHSGVLTGHSRGIDDIIYTVTNSCGTSSSSAHLQIGCPDFTEGIVTGPTSVCHDAVITMSDTAAAGVWYTDNTTLATVNSSGQLTGHGGGFVGVFYQVTRSCGTVTAGTTIRVYDPTAPNIIGYPVLCLGTTPVLSNPSSGGIWSGSDDTKATITTSGIVTPILRGSVTMDYNYANSCGSIDDRYLSTVDSLPDPGHITGANSVCAGSSLTLVDSLGGGYWTKNNGYLKFDSTTEGVFWGTYHGITQVYYNRNNACGTTSVISYIYVLGTPPQLPQITGYVNVCVGSSALHEVDFVGGGTWGITDPTKASITDGIVTGISAGEDTVLYTYTNTCGSETLRKGIHVLPLPPSASLTVTATDVCVGDTVNITPATPGGTWVRIGTAITNHSGTVLGLLDGVGKVIYSVHNSCGVNTDSVLITSHARPVLSSLLGSNLICSGGTTTLSATPAGGTWTSSNSSVTVLSSGVFSGVAEGTDTVHYSYTDTFGCNSQQSRTVYVLAVPDPGTITGTSAITIGTMDTLHCSVSGGTWSLADTSSALSLNAARGIVTALATGTATVRHSVSNTHCSAQTTFLVSVTGARSAHSSNSHSGEEEAAANTIELSSIRIYPNPSRGVVTLDLSELKGKVEVRISDITGRRLQAFEVEKDEDKKADLDFSMKGKGIYIINILANGNEYTQKLVVE